jgi:hypothetical protein
MAMVWLMCGLGADPPDSLNDGERIAKVADYVNSGLHTTLDAHFVGMEGEKRGCSPFIAACIDVLHFFLILRWFGESGKSFEFSGFDYYPPPAR